MSEKRNGYVFVNNDNKYAAVVPNSGFGSATHIVCFVANIHDATVFTNPNAFYGTHLTQDARKNLLKHCQTLKVTTQTIVSLNNWSDDNGAKN